MLSSTESSKERQTGAGLAEHTSKTCPEDELVNALASSLRTEDGISNLVEPVDGVSPKLSAEWFLDKRSLSTFRMPGMCFSTSRKR